MVMLHQPRVTGNKHSTGSAHLASIIKLRTVAVGGMLLANPVGEESGDETKDGEDGRGTVACGARMYVEFPPMTNAYHAILTSSLRTCSDVDATV
jgi:hypothetical protein